VREIKNLLRREGRCLSDEARQSEGEQHGSHAEGSEGGVKEVDRDAEGNNKRSSVDVCFKSFRDWFKLVAKAIIILTGRATSSRSYSLESFFIHRNTLLLTGNELGGIDSTGPCIHTLRATRWPKAVYTMHNAGKFVYIEEGKRKHGGHYHT
jgi:hypothetical protein